jgi:hypothetical protein
MLVQLCQTLDRVPDEVCARVCVCAGAKGSCAFCGWGWGWVVPVVLLSCGGVRAS